MTRVNRIPNQKRANGKLPKISQFDLVVPLKPEPPATPIYNEQLERYRQERRARKAANFAKRLPK